MWKMLIADDEMIIRRGLRHAIDWASLDIEIVGEAEDGKDAVDKCEVLRPDLLLVDICMPFINGLELIQMVNQLLPDAVILIVTGHDEFNYAKKAVKLNVFDYLLKPVDEEELEQSIKRAVMYLQNTKHERWMDQQKTQVIETNKDSIRNAFVLELLQSGSSMEDVQRKLEFFNLNYHHKIGMILIKPMVQVNLYDEVYDFNDELLYFSIMNIVEETFQNIEEDNEFIVVQKNYEHIIGIISFTHKLNWYELGANIESNVEKFLRKKVFVLQEMVQEGMEHADKTYQALLTRLEMEQMHTPAVMVAKKYIDTYFYKSDISLDEVALFVKVNPTYLSRLLKNELGNSFVDYLTKVRIKKSIEYMNDHSLKMYEIAEQVGYNTQHYFSTAFKKVMGVSPNNYKIGGEQIK